MSEAPVLDTCWNVGPLFIDPSSKTKAWKSTARASQYVFSYLSRRPFLLPPGTTPSPGLTAPLFNPNPDPSPPIETTNTPSSVVYLGTSTEWASALALRVVKTQKTWSNTRILPVAPDTDVIGVVNIKKVILLSPLRFWVYIQGASPAVASIHIIESVDDALKNLVARFPGVKALDMSTALDLNPEVSLDDWENEEQRVAAATPNKVEILKESGQFHLITAFRYVFATENVVFSFPFQRIWNEKTWASGTACVSIDALTKGCLPCPVIDAGPLFCKALPALKPADATHWLVWYPLSRGGFPVLLLDTVARTIPPQKRKGTLTCPRLVSMVDVDHSQTWLALNTQKDKKYARDPEFAPAGIESPFQTGYTGAVCAALAPRSGTFVWDVQSQVFPSIIASARKATHVRARPKKAQTEKWTLTDTINADALKLVTTLAQKGTRAPVAVSVTRT